MGTNERIISVDVLRGLTVAAMILVNNPGSWEHLFSWLEHAHWHGFQFADIIFPSFLFIVGISISYALSGALKPEADKAAFAKRVFKRSLLLFLIGLFLNIFPFIDNETYYNSGEYALMNFDTFRIPGVLQRISIVFLFTALLYIYASKRTQLITLACILLGYWGLMTLVPVPGVGPANLDIETNLGAWLDRTILGQHLWIWAKTWDPEGLLSTLPAVGTGIIGLLTGQVLRNKESINSQKMKSLLLAAVALTIGGLVWNYIFPINKSLWTSSYVLLTGGLSILLLCLVYWLVDIKKLQGGTTPCLAFGSNAMAAYVLSEIIARLADLIPLGEVSLKEFIFRTVFTSWLPSNVASLTMAICWVVMIYIPIRYLYAKKIYIKV